MRAPRASERANDTVNFGKCNAFNSTSLYQEALQQAGEELALGVGFSNADKTALDAKALFFLDTSKPPIQIVTSANWAAGLSEEFLNPLSAPLLSCLLDVRHFHPHKK